MNRRRARWYWLALLVLIGLVASANLGTIVDWAAGAAAGAQAAPAGTTPAPAAGPTRVQLPAAQATSTTVETAVPSPTTPPTLANSPTPTETPLPAATQTALYLASCVDAGEIQPDLLTIVDREVALPRDFEPADLETVPLDTDNRHYRPITMRRVVQQPLLDLVEAMNQAGLEVMVMSGYRSYSEQTLAYEKWQALYPDRTDISAVPGHSEHQLGTAVDFSAPYMDDLYGDFFNVRFSRTPEGEWLSQHAAAYGFTLSYPAEATELTGYAWEPWHFRYVGALALELSARGMTLTHYLRQCPQPLSNP